MPGFKRATVAVALLVQCAWAADEVPISAAEKQLFTTDHLSDLPQAATLRYDFVKSGTLEKGYKDDVTMSVGKSQSNGGGKHVSVKFLNGDHRVELPELDDARGNPIVMFFLEHDVREMQRITRGQSNYYRRRIRVALADHATSRPVTFDWGGHAVKGTVIEVEPYRDDPVKQRFEKYANKKYEFTLSDEVPGSIYKLRTIMGTPGAEVGSGGSPVLVEEVLTLRGVDR